MKLQIDSEVVYVSLLHEGTDVWRPARAFRVGRRLFVLARPPLYDADDEHWEFPPGAVVRCERKLMGEESVLVAVEGVDVVSR